MQSPIRDFYEYSYICNCFNKRDINNENKSRDDGRNGLDGCPKGVCCTERSSKEKSFTALRIEGIAKDTILDHLAGEETDPVMLADLFARVKNMKGDKMIRFIRFFYDLPEPVFLGKRFADATGMNEQQGSQKKQKHMGMRPIRVILFSL